MEQYRHFIRREILCYEFQRILFRFPSSSEAYRMSKDNLVWKNMNTLSFAIKQHKDNDDPGAMSLEQIIYLEKRDDTDKKKLVVVNQVSLFIGHLRLQSSFKSTTTLAVPESELERTSNALCENTVT